MRVADETRGATKEPRDTTAGVRRTFARPLVIGASGQVGTVLGGLLSEQGGWVLRSSRSGTGVDLALDLAQLGPAQRVFHQLDALKPDAIFCAGAMTYVDGCEAMPERAMAANATGPGLLAEYAGERNLPFVFFSSDYVFPGTTQDPGPYTEFHQTGPLNVYGRTKLLGEQAVLQAAPGALVLRTSWVYGADPAEKNFISSLRRKLLAGASIRVPDDQISTPTWNDDLARAAIDLARSRAHGVVHVAGPECLSRFDLARRVASFYDLDERLVEGVPTEALQQTAPRPLLAGLRSERLPLLLPGFRFAELEQGLSTAAKRNSPIG